MALTTLWGVKAHIEKALQITLIVVDNLDAYVEHISAIIKKPIPRVEEEHPIEHEESMSARIKRLIPWVKKEHSVNVNNEIRAQKDRRYPPPSQHGKQHVRRRAVPIRAIVEESEDTREP